MSRIRSNILIFFFFIFAMDVVLIDYISYLSGLEYSTALIISSIMILLCMIYLIKCFQFDKLEVCIFDILAIAIIIIPAFIRGIMPDSSFDTSNYHLFFQEFLGKDFVNENFFPIRAVNASTIALGDRMFYIFRFFLGYRGGTILSTLVIVIAYFQVRDIIKEMCRHLKIGFGKKRELVISGICSLLCLGTENVFNNLATYMVDYLAVPFLIEIIRIVILKKEDEENRYTPIYLCLLAGIATAVKMTNAVIILPLAIFYLVNNRKNINYKIVAGGFLASIMCIFIYLYMSWRITGNPLFPYLNQLFLSPYFTVEASPNDLSAFNTNFGPKTITEYLIWPLLMILHPERSADIAFCSGRLLIIVVVLAFCIIKNKNYDSVIRKMIFLLAVFYLIFILFFSGYMRYMPVLEILGSALIFVLSIYWIRKKSTSRKIFVILLYSCVMIQTGSALNKYVNKNYEWAWRDISDIGRIQANLPYLFNDYESGLPKTLLDEIESLVILDASGSLAVNIKKDVPMVNLTTGVTNEYTEKLRNEYLSQIKDTNIFSLNKKDDFLSNLSLLEEFGLSIERIIPISPDFYDKFFCMPLLKLLPVENQIKIEQYSSSEREYKIELSDNIKKLDIFIGDVVNELKWNNTPYLLSVKLLDSSTGETITVFDKEEITQRSEYVSKTIELDSKYNYLLVYMDDYEGYDALGQTYQIILQSY